MSDEEMEEQKLESKARKALKKPKRSEGAASALHKAILASCTLSSIEALAIGKLRPIFDARSRWALKRVSGVDTVLPGLIFSSLSAAHEKRNFNMVPSTSARSGLRRSISSRVDGAKNDHQRSISFGNSKYPFRIP